VAISPVTGQVYISSADTNQAFILDGRTNDVTSTLATGPGPEGIALNPRAGTVYLVIANDNQVSMLDGRTNQVIATVDVGDLPVGAVYSPLTNSVYVTNLDSNTVSVIGWQGFGGPLSGDQGGDDVADLSGREGPGGVAHR
jgi:YVTN family beta-propeller protein